jgi:DNA-binding winged helix-turn-helix (wHTH) protein/tetratricopeptide (TPR) repeat protein
MPALEKIVYKFGAFELEPGERRLSEGDKLVSLTPKVFDTLVLLVQSAGQVVSKEELMKALWPRGYVEESNLTKHIWLIRRALGDGDQASRFIETVPKSGYRFVAPVSVGEAPPRGPQPAAREASDAAPPQDPPLADPPELASPARAPLWRYRRLYLGLAAAILVGALGWLLMVDRHGLTKDPALPAERSVAFVGFSNLSKNPKDAWLAPALNEMLGAELGVANDVRVIPDELVRNAAADLSPPAAGGYSARTLTELRRRLDADFVVSGSFMVSGNADDAPLRVDLAVQDARTGARVASLSKESAMSSLLALVHDSGSALRGKLSKRMPGEETLARVANAEPPSVDVARRLGFALDALQHYDAARARDELLDTVAEAPGFAPVYRYLAEAWSELGYRDKALAAAEQAAARASNLPQEQQLEIDAVAAAAHADWAKAAAAWRSLSQLKPLDLEYRLRLVDAELAAGLAAEAERSWRELARLPDASADARVELAAVRVADARNDAEGGAAHAASALRLARDHDAEGLVADAQRALGAADMLLNRNEQARAEFAAAIDAYRAIRNPRGEAVARTELAQALGNLNRNQESREEYQRAMSLDQSIGDLAGMAQVYRKQSGILWVAGDRDGAQVAAGHALELSRETGDLAMQSWSLQALATIESDDMASDAVLDKYREVVALYQRIGQQTAWPLTNIADLQRMRGELDAAADTCASAHQQAASLTDPQFEIFSSFECALIEFDRGNAAGARAGFAHVIERVGTGGDTSYRHNAVMMLAQLDMDDGHWETARDHLKDASHGFAAAEERTGEADCEAMLALSEQALGETAARDQALERARTLRQSITSHQEVYVVDITLARLRDRAAGAGARADTLLAVAKDAERRRFVGWSLEAKLAAFELLTEQQAQTALSLRRDIETNARSHGFGRILRRLRDADGNRGRHAARITAPQRLS